jgi:hypothetical protein
MNAFLAQDTSALRLLTALPDTGASIQSTVELVDRMRERGLPESADYRMVGADVGMDKFGRMLRVAFVVPRVQSKFLVSVELRPDSGSDGRIVAVVVDTIPTVEGQH